MAVLSKMNTCHVYGTIPVDIEDLSSVCYYTLEILQILYTKVDQDGRGCAIEKGSFVKPTNSVSFTEDD